MRSVARAISAAILALGSVLSTGCASADPIVKWRQGVETFLRDHGNGDVTSLRGHEAAPGVPGFAVNSVRSGGWRPMSAERVDACGVLLAGRKINGQSWWLWLVGATKFHGSMTYVPLEHATVTDIRLVAMRQLEDGSLDWRTGGANNDSLTMYIRAQRAEWVADHPEDAHDRDAPRVVFPLATDDFILDISGSAARVRHAQTGAAWEVNLADGKATGQADASHE